MPDEHVEGKGVVGSAGGGCTLAMGVTLMGSRGCWAPGLERVCVSGRGMAVCPAPGVWVPALRVCVPVTGEGLYLSWGCGYLSRGDVPVPGGCTCPRGWCTSPGRCVAVPGDVGSCPRGGCTCSSGVCTCPGGVYLSWGACVPVPWGAVPVPEDVGT